MSCLEQLDLWSTPVPLSGQHLYPFRLGVLQRLLSFLNLFGPLVPGVSFLSVCATNCAWLTISTHPSICFAFLQIVSIFLFLLYWCLYLAWDETVLNWISIGISIDQSLPTETFHSLQFIIPLQRLSTRAIYHASTNMVYSLVFCSWIPWMMLGYCECGQEMITLMSIKPTHLVNCTTWQSFEPLDNQPDSFAALWCSHKHSPNPYPVFLFFIVIGIAWSSHLVLE